MNDNQHMGVAERATLRQVLRDWRVPAQQAAVILRHAVSGPGAVGLVPADAERGVGIMVNEVQDPKLARLFGWRARLEDEQFARRWQTDPVPRAHVILCPHAPEAIWAYHLVVRRPVKLERTYLLLFSKHAPILSFLEQSGSVIWLVPETVAVREWAREGLGTADELVACALPVGAVQAPLPGLEMALEHVGYRAR